MPVLYVFFNFELVANSFSLGILDYVEWELFFEMRRARKLIVLRRFYFMLDALDEVWIIESIILLCVL